MKKVIIQILALVVSGAAMAQGVLHANVIDNKTGRILEKTEQTKEKNLVKQENVKPIEKKNNVEKFLNGVENNNIKDYQTQEGFWKDKKYSTTLIFYGCEMRINDYLIDINSISYVDVETLNLYFHFDSRRERGGMKNENDKNEFLEEYRFRRSVCSFRRAL